ncbi:unnamed protein product [Lymnaea stagnalis]|uniref:RING-type E3 ubiquitin transferase n=1 Tax=Lymnaea stagnalis TaxID=6523 RepID=A0AAV2HGT9_LYMST
MEQSAPSKIEYTCPICMYLLIEPVTLPCKHSFCLTCYRQTVEISNLTCPICRMRISVWARKASKSNTLIDQVKWQYIKEAFPLEVQHRLEGEDYDDEESDFQEDHETQLRKLKEISRPGEIRQEYEAALEKLQRQREEEAKREEEASAALIRALQQEADEEMVERLRQKEELEKIDKEAAIRLEQVSIRSSVENRSPVPKTTLKRGSKKGKRNQPPIKGGSFLTLNTFFNTVPHSAFLNDSLSPKQRTNGTRSDHVSRLMDLSASMGQLSEDQLDPGPSGQQYQSMRGKAERKTANNKILTESCEYDVKTLEISEFEVHHRLGERRHVVPSQRLGHSMASNPVQAEFSPLVSLTAAHSDNPPGEDNQLPLCGHRSRSCVNKNKTLAGHTVSCHGHDKTILCHGLSSCHQKDEVENLTMPPVLSAEEMSEGDTEVYGDGEVSFKFKSVESERNFSEEREQSSEPVNDDEFNPVVGSSGDSIRSCDPDDCETVSSDDGHIKLTSCPENVGKRSVQRDDTCSSDGDESLRIKWDSEISLNITEGNSNSESSMFYEDYCEDTWEKKDVEGLPSGNVNGTLVFESVTETNCSGGGHLSKNVNNNSMIKGNVKTAPVNSKKSTGLSKNTCQSVLKWLHTGDKKASDLKLPRKRKRLSSGLGEGTSNSSESPVKDEMTVSLEDVDQSHMTQEQSDHLVALRLQKMYEKLDKSNIRVDRFKGAKDQYSLRKKRKLTQKAKSTL